jgi:hypothetical protein
MSYVGNSPGWESSKDVDIIDAPSTGSILKPLLYAGMLLEAVTQYASCRYPNADCGLHLKFQPDI